MKDQNIKTVRQYIRDELSHSYPEGELWSLTKIILQEVTALSSTEILVEPERPVSKHAWDKISKIVSQLKEKKPIQYILGKTEFYGLSLKLNKHTLIPRPETEELVDLVIRENKQEGLKVLDLGTGSGAIAIALSRNLKNPEITATDISREALEVAIGNSRINRCAITFTRDDILESSVKEAGSFDLVLSNPPYIREKEKELMQANVLDYEPGPALFVPDKDPLLYYRAIGKLARQVLKAGGGLYVEINEALGKETADLFLGIGLGSIRIIKDINNKDRFVSARSL